MDLKQMCISAKNASRTLVKLSQPIKNTCLLTMADYLIKYSDKILKANELDIKIGKENHMPEALLDRLTLTNERIIQIAEGVRQVAALEDPIGEVTSMKARPNGLLIGKKRVPLGVIAIIYESRPNVTVDAFSLCFKTGNSVILRGGSDALQSNIAFVEVIKEALKQNQISEDAISLITDTSRETATKLMQMNDYIDVLIPRGGASLIQSVVKNATIPVIETGTGNCHIFIDEYADENQAISIIENAKFQRLGVCNACESLVIHKNIINSICPKLLNMLFKNNCVVYGDEFITNIDNQVLKATNEDYAKEYLDKIISIKVVENLEEAITHINNHSTGHSESIITSNYENAQQFLNEIDSAAVYVNASTRFTDGFEFGFGAEIGISTQKLHARGPMGLEALTTTKYIIYGNGQIRP